MRTAKRRSIARTRRAPSRRDVVIGAGALAASVLAPSSPAAAQTPGEANRPPPNPFLAPDAGKSVMHFDPANSDSTPYAAWMGTQTVEPARVHTVPGNLLNVGYAFRRYPDGTEALIFSGPTSVGKVRIDGGRFDLVHVLVMPGYERSHITMVAMRDGLTAIDAAGNDTAKMQAAFRTLLRRAGLTAGGLSTVLDRDGFYYAGYGTKLFKIGDASPGGVAAPLRVVASVETRERAPKRYPVEPIAALNLTYDGYVVVAQPGMIGVADRNLNNYWYVTVPDEDIDSVIAVDEKGGVYVATSRQMRKLVWTGDTLHTIEEEGAWSSPYDIGERVPQASASRSGATPTLMGFGNDADRLVLMVDAAQPVRIVAFWRDGIPSDARQVEGAASRRVADQMPLMIPASGVAKWSLQTHGYGALVTNARLPEPLRTGEGETLMGVATTPNGPRGAEKFTWGPTGHRFERRWRNDAPLQWGLHPMAVPTGTVHLLTHEDGVFKLLGLDWESGGQVADIALGRSQRFNVAGGFMQPLPNGDLYVSGLFGPVLVRKAG